VDGSTGRSSVLQRRAIVLVPELRDRIERLVGARIRELRPARGGYSAAERWIVQMDTGRSAFVKVGIPPVASENLRQETLVYQRLQLACMPQVIAWEDDALHPLLALEDLSHFEWPPPWSDRSIDVALLAIQSIHASTGRLDAYEERHGLEKTGWWSSIARNPEPFLRLGLRTEEWLDAALPSLIHASETVSPAGESVCHFDLRSDNICLSSERGVVIDWSHACLGNPRIDLGLFLPGIADEGGPLPEEILPDAPGIAAWVSGFFAVHASKAFIPSAPQVRVMQRKHLVRSLEWAERELSS
jgi:hypothetical protein